MTSAEVGSAVAGPRPDPEWDFADRIRAVRRKVLRIEQGAFAELLGVKRQAYAAWESGRTEPRDIVSIANRIEMLCGVRAAWVLGVGGPSPSDTLWERLAEQPDDLATPCADNVVHVEFCAGFADTAVPRRAA